MSLAMGTRLGPYDIVSRLGAGGMGEVYKAYDARLQRFVAIRILPSQYVSDPDRKRRLTQEARASSALNHPNIVTVHDISAGNGHDYIVMEYVPGKTLTRTGLAQDSKGEPSARTCRHRARLRKPGSPRATRH